MAVSKKTSSKNIDSDQPGSSASSGPAAATATANRNTDAKKAAPVKKKRVAKKRAAPLAKKKTADKQVTAEPSPSAGTQGNGAKPVISQQQRQQLIGDGAYLISLKRDPWQGSPEIDWLSAETMVDMIFDVAD